MTWYTIKAQADNTPAEISIYDEIGGWGVTAKDFIADLKALGDAKEITLSINSPGGSVFDALAMYNALCASGAEITTKVLGIAASAASVVAMAGKKIVMPENAFMMVHNPLTLAYGNAGEMRDMADVLDKITASLVNTYVARTGLPEADVRALLDAETYLTAAEAKEKGFADEVVPALAVKASFDMKRLPASMQAVFKAATDPQPAPAADPEPIADPAPAADPAPGPDPEPTAAAPFADQVIALAAEADMHDFAAHWALQFKDTAEVKAAIAVAREIRALCAVAKQPESATEHIKAGASIETVRAALLAARASTSESSHVDTTPNPKNTPAASAQPKAASSTSIWAARIKQTR